MTNPDMIIFHEPDELEFAAGGKSLGTFKEPQAQSWFYQIQSAPATMTVGLMINAIQSLQFRKANLASPTGEPAGFDRSNQNG